MCGKKIGVIKIIFRRKARHYQKSALFVDCVLGHPQKNVFEKSSGAAIVFTLEFARVVLGILDATLIFLP